jgi:Ribbon-helix-helix protein, copG family
LAKAVRNRAASRSGTPTTPNAKRTRPMVTLTLSPEALARLDAIAGERGQTRSGAVEQLVRNARLGK